MLSDLPPAEVLAAATKHVREKGSAFPPSVGELRALAAPRSRVVKIPHFVTDCWGRKVIREDGQPAVERWHEVELPPGYAGDVGQIDMKCLPPGARVLPGPNAVPTREVRPQYRDELTAAEKARSWDRAQRAEDDAAISIAEALDDLGGEQ